jgi:TrmH family RNA methyltransferase
VTGETGEYTRGVKKPHDSRPRRDKQDRAAREGPGQGRTADGVERVDGLDVLTSSDNQRLKAAAALHTGRGRRRAERFLLEGPKAVLEVLARRSEWIELLLVRIDRRERKVPDAAVEALAAARAKGVVCVGVASNLFDDIAPADSPQPVLAVAKQGWADLGTVLGENDQAPRAVAALAGVQDPGNVGTILRTARFFGLSGVVLLPGAQDPWAPKVARASAGALIETPPAKAETLEELVTRATAAGLVPVALDAHGGEDPRVVPLPPRTLLLLGAEGPGLPPGLTVRKVTLAPRDAGAESLNVAVAFGVVAALWAGASGRPG